MVGYVTVPDSIGGDVAVAMHFVEKAVPIITDNASFVNRNNFSAKIVGSKLFIKTGATKSAVSIINLAGKKIADQSFSDNCEINISHISKGVYLANVSAKGKNEAVRFVVK